MYVEQIIIFFILVVATFLIHNSRLSIKNKYFVFSIIVLVGIAIVLFRMKLSKELGLLMFILGSSWILYYSSNIVQPNNKRTKIIAYLSLDGFLDKYFHYLGFLGILVILLFEYYYSDFIIGQSSVLALIFSVILILFNFIPKQFWIERDFLFFFFFLLCFFVIFPQILESFFYNIGYIEDIESTNSKVVTIFLSKPLIALLNLLGYNFSYQQNTIYFPDLEAGHTNSVWIAKSCSGYYSVIIFISAYLSYLVSKQENLDTITILWAFIGIIIAYIANLFRMAIIILAGHYWGVDALVWTHTNVGWLIFTFWVAIFWSISSKALESKH